MFQDKCIYTQRSNSLAYLLDCRKHLQPQRDAAEGIMIKLPIIFWNATKNNSSVLITWQNVIKKAMHFVYLGFALIQPS